MPIRLRLALAFAIVVAIVFTVVALQFERSFRHGLESSLDQTLRVQATALTRAVNDAGATVDLGDRATGALRDNEDVAQLIDAAGRVVDATDDLERGPLVPVADIPRAGEGALIRRLDLAEQDDEDGDTEDGDTERFRVLAREIEGADGIRYVVVGTSLQPTDEAVGRLTDGLLIGGVAAVVLAGIGAWFLAGAALRPVDRLRREAESLSVHDPSARLEVARTHDELQALGTTMNDLLARLQSALARQRAFVADAGHELRTPIAVLRTELELARRDGRSRDELADAVDHAYAETERLTDLIEALLLLARSDSASVSTRRDRVVVADVVASAAAGLETVASAKHVEIETVCDDAITVTGDGTLLRRALENLLENALRHSPDGSEVRIEASEVRGTVSIAVADRGSGFPEDFLPHAFERFRRADDARTRTEGGHGLGLAIVLAIMHAHGGDAVAANRPDGGAVVTLSLPARSAAAGL